MQPAVPTHRRDSFTEFQLSLLLHPNSFQHGSTSVSTNSVSSSIFNPSSSPDSISLTSPSGLKRRVAKRSRIEHSEKKPHASHYEQIQQVPEFEASQSSPVSSEKSPKGTPNHELASDDEPYVQSSVQCLNGMRRYRTILPKSPSIASPTIRQEGYMSNNPSVPMLAGSPSMPTPQYVQPFNEQQLSDPFMGQIAVHASHVVSPGLVPTGSPLNHKDIYRQSMQQNFFLSCGYSPAILQTISQKIQGDDPEDLRGQIAILRKMEELAKLVKEDLACKTIERSIFASIKNTLEDIARKTSAIADRLGDERILRKRKRETSSSQATTSSSERECNDCGTKETGQWRYLRDAGNKPIADLCNACGIKRGRAAKEKKKTEAAMAAFMAEAEAEK